MGPAEVAGLAWQGRQAGKMGPAEFARTGWQTLPGPVCQLAGLAGNGLANSWGPLWLALAHSEVLLHSRLLHAVQGLDVHRAAAPALVAVRASARPAREAHKMARRVKAPLDGPGGAHQRRGRPRHREAPCRRASCAGDSQRCLAGSGQDSGARRARLRSRGSAPEAAASAALAKPSPPPRPFGAG